MYLISRVSQEPVCELRIGVNLKLKNIIIE